jgi:glycosyltransferase involved in cell wall biosynthesis
MISPPRVSVITPFFNAEAYLAEALASVKAQTFGDWELILVDDGATDTSSAIALEACKEDCRVKLLGFSGSRRGAAAARNAGMRTGSGEFFAFLDADDRFEPEMLQTVVAAADRNPRAALVFGPTRWWYPDGQREDWIEPTFKLGGRLHAPPKLLKQIILMQDGHVPCTCSVLVRRSAVMEVGGFDESFRLYEDQTLWVKLFLRYPVYVTPVCLSNYRQHPQSLSALATRHGEYDRMRAHQARSIFLDWVAEYVAGSGGEDKGLNRAIRLARAPYAGTHCGQGIADRILYQMLITAARVRRRFKRRFLRGVELIWDWSRPRG